jgi:hypothetical protein
VELDSEDEDAPRAAKPEAAESDDDDEVEV